MIGFWELPILAVGLSMDAFAVSVCKGMSGTHCGPGLQLKCGLWFGAFQALMPVLGFYLGALFVTALARAAPWVAFGLMSIVGINMLKEAMEDEKAETMQPDFSVPSMLLLAFATSVDALAVGLSLSMAGQTEIFSAAALIGTVTFLLSGLGVRLGTWVGDRFRRKAQIAGGMILLLLGVKMLLDQKIF